MRPTRLTLAVALLSAASSFAASSASAAAGPQPPNCPLLLPDVPIERTLAVGGGQRAVVRDPYGNLLVRNSRFFDFSVRASPAAKARIGDVTWALDGVVKRTDPTAPYEWKGVSGSTKMPVGDHVITVTLHRKDGTAPEQTSFALTATDCGPVESFTEIEFFTRDSTFSTLYATSSLQRSSGPTMRAVTFRSDDVSVHLPVGARGKTVGRLRIGSGDARPPKGVRTYTLRLPRHGTRLLSRGALRVTLHPTANGYLTVSGLPAPSREVQVRLDGAGAALVRERRVGPNRCRYTSSATIFGQDGTVNTPEGTVTGVCHR